MLALLLLTSAAHGGPDRRTIRREVKRHLENILACYGGQLESRIVLTFVIGRSGRVTSATASGAGDPALRRCVVGVFKRMTFPPSRDVTKVTYPLQICTAGQ